MYSNIDSWMDRGLLVSFRGVIQALPTTNHSHHWRRICIDRNLRGKHVCRVTWSEFVSISMYLIRSCFHLEILL